MRITSYDWNEVVKMNPHGYAEFQDHSEGIVIHGPVKSVIVDASGQVHITLKWAAKMGLMETPEFGEWKFIRQDWSICFTNFTLPFSVQDTPSKGRRILFGGMQIMYLNAPSELDTSKIEGFVEPS